MNGINKELRSKINKEVAKKEKAAKYELLLGKKTVAIRNAIECRKEKEQIDKDFNYIGE